MNKPKIKTTEKCIVFTYQDRVKNVPEMSTLILSIMEDFKNKYPNIKPVFPSFCYLSYPEGILKEENFLIKFSQAVEVEGENMDKFKFETIPERKVVSLLYKGPYNKLNDAYNEVTNFIVENNLKAKDPIMPIEIYISGPWNKTFPEDFETEIQVAIE